MLVFWRHDYENASLTDLTEAVVSRPTLYAMFGEKAELCREAVAAYSALKDEGPQVALANPTARERSQRLRCD